MLGPSGGGKTTILYGLRLSEVNKLFRTTAGYNYEVVRVPYQGRYKYDIHMWDLSGQDELKSVWPFFYNSFENANVLLYVLNANDPETIKSSKPEFHRLVHEQKFLNAYKLVILNMQNAAAEDKVDEEDARQLLGFNELDLEFTKIEIFRINAFLVEDVSQITEKICKYYTDQVINKSNKN